MGSEGLVLIVNPQWSTEGQVVPDFGILPWVRKANEELVASFTQVGRRFLGWPSIRGLQDFAGVALTVGGLCARLAGLLPEAAAHQRGRSAAAQVLPRALGGARDTRPGGRV